MTFQNAYDDIVSNLSTEGGRTFWDETDLFNSIQDAYDDIVFQSQCIVKKVTLSFQSNLNYYKPSDLGVTDFMACTAIFNNLTNLWLLDGQVLKDFDNFRPDWENWIGNPVWWAPAGPDRIAIVPKQLTAAGTFNLYYWAQAPILDISTYKGVTPQIAADMVDLIEFYCTADLLEQDEEFTKAVNYWAQYYDPETGLPVYAERVKNLAKADLLMLA